ncbi:MAG: aminotransferase class III-fold pyridoxal phosphate-dependent enzyme, partial [Actinomycetes bacterium]
VSDAAVAALSLVLHDLENPLLLVRDVVLGFHGVLPLTETEIDAVWPLVVARAAACVVSSEQQAAMEPHNQYAQDSREGDDAIMRAVASVPPLLARQTLRTAVGLPGPSPAPRLPLLGPLFDGQATLTPVDLSVTSRWLREGAWHSVEAVASAVRDAAGHGRTPYAAYGRARLSAAQDDCRDEPAATSLGLDVFAPVGSAVRSPLDATVTSVDPLTLAITDATHALVLGGVATTVSVGGPVTAGDLVGHVAMVAGCDLPPHVHVQWAPPGVPAPSQTTASLAPAWLALCPDPSASMRLEPSESPASRSASALLDRRENVVAGVQEHYYSAPPRIERGWRHHLYDTDARSYLDVVNNVATLGHSHPAVTNAVVRQLELLNTNSRFNYRAIVDFSERLASLLPDPLDTVFLVNSGSEAVDLALRIARSATGHDHVISVQSAYHGWTTATDAVSTSLADNPQAMSNRPAWVHPVLSPNVYRGEHRGDDAAQLYADDVARAVSDVREVGGGVAAYVAEALYGNAGGVLLPAGYLTRVYSTVREAGGLCIADEVQVGYGRTGHHFWAFEQQDVVPDIVTVAKAAGNGMAVAAVVTTRAVADAFASQGSFFSSVGGSPVSCAAGLAVIDTVLDEGLQENARVVGDHLRTRLEQLAELHPIIGAVHGLGLYLGVELVRDRDTLEPATDETAAICDRMLSLGVIVQPTADHLNVLKVKPPMCLTRSSADFFVDVLDEVLANGW